MHAQVEPADADRDDPDDGGLLPAAAYRWLGMNAILAFWLSYVVTRPLGASFADFLAGPDWRGGLSLGFPPITVVMTVMIVAALVYLSKTGDDQPVDTSAALPTKVAPTL